MSDSERSLPVRVYHAVRRRLLPARYWTATEIRQAEWRGAEMWEYFREPRKPRTCTCGEGPGPTIHKYECERLGNV